MFEVEERKRIWKCT